MENEQSTGGTSPTVVGGLISAAVLALLGVINAFGGSFTGEQTDAIMDLVNILLALGALATPLVVNRYYVWKRVTPVDDPHDNEGRRLVPEENTE